MIIAIPRETTAGETRVSATPETVKKYVSWGFETRVETAAGLLAGFNDEDYLQVGAKIMATPQALYNHADFIIKIWAPLPSEDAFLSSGQTILAHFQALNSHARLADFAKLGLTCIALELMPRISRAQSMDILSSQSNLAGYKAVIDAVNLLPSAVPLMMTAAGTITPARVLILGAGVAGLQAIATAKRLGAQVYASDVRPAVKEQVESLGARFVEVESSENFETKTGYAAETTEKYRQAQELAVAEQLTKTDIAITTALIPGKKAPLLINECMLRRMPRGSIVIDMATSNGGNVEGSQDNTTIEIEGIKVVGNSNLAAGLPRSASLLFAKNIYNFLAPLYQNEPGRLVLNFDDELVRATCVTNHGQILIEE